MVRGWMALVAAFLVVAGTLAVFIFDIREGYLLQLVGFAIYLGSYLVGKIKDGSLQKNLAKLGRALPSILGIMVSVGFALFGLAMMTSSIQAIANPGYPFFQHLLYWGHLGLGFGILFLSLGGIILSIERLRTLKA